LYGCETWSLILRKEYRLFLRIEFWRELLFIYLFVVYLTTLFNNSDYIASKDMVISKLWSGNDLKRSGRGVILTYHPDIRLEGLRKPAKKPQIRIAGLGTSRIRGRSVNHSTTTLGRRIMGRKEGSSREIVWNCIMMAVTLCYLTPNIIKALKSRCGKNTVRHVACMGQTGNI
jgi:hypothetical protein